jgi:hypothetical protein
MTSEHRFPDTVQEYIFQGFSQLAGRNPAVPNSRVFGTSGLASAGARQNVACAPSQKSRHENVGGNGGQESAKAADFSLFSDEGLSLYVPLSKGTI